jgi:O-antigen/teichoic acid export membrane protein
LASDLVKIIPRYLKWEPALLALYLYSFNSAWATISTSMTNLLNAIGKIKKTFQLMTMWLVLTWALMPVLGIKLGYNGVALAAALISLSSLVAIMVARKYVPFSLVSSVGKPFLAASLMGLIIYFFRPMAGSLAFSVVLRTLTGGFVYFALSYFLVGAALVADIKRFANEMRSRS